MFVEVLRRVEVEDSKSTEVRPGRRLRISKRPRVDVELVIPAFNEERRIGKTVRTVLGYLERQRFRSAVVVVDNGSVDRTVDAAMRGGAKSAVPLHVLNCGRRGKGAAVRAGVLSSSARIVGFMDADLATPIETFDQMFPFLDRGEPVVIASRKGPGATYVVPQPLPRRLGSAAFGMAAGLLVDGIEDTQCGFKFFQGDVARDLFRKLTVEDFAFDVELLALAQRQGLPIREVPVEWTDRAGSTFRPIADGVSAVAAVVGAWIRSRRGSRGRSAGAD